MNFTDQLKTYRKEHNKSQGEMAEMLGISQQVYSNIERGINKKWDSEIVDRFEQLKTTTNDPEQPYTTTDWSKETMLKLANANEILAKAHYNIAESNKDLVQMLKAATVGEKKETFVDFDTMFGNLLGLIADILSDKKPKSKNEVAALLSRVYHV